MFQFDELEEKHQLRIIRLIDLWNRHIALYTIVSDKPLIFFMWIGPNLQLFTQNYQFLFDSLKGRKAIIICCTWRHFEYAESITELDNLLKKFKSDYPHFTFHFLCNTPSQLDLFTKQNINSIFCNSNCFIDEKLFLPISGVEKKFDAVYDGCLIECKRHHLALDIDSLALIYYPVPWIEDNSYMKKLTQDFSHAQFFNHNESGEYRKLTPAEVNQGLNQCRVGLCLSAEEGAMYASIQYLLAGLPVVTTSSLGGRDVFFDDEISITVEPTPQAVKIGVQEMIARNISPQYIREKTLERIKIHRNYFIELVQSIYNEEEIHRDFSVEWNEIFFNKLLRNQNHLAVIKRINSFS